MLPAGAGRAAAGARNCGRPLLGRRTRKRPIPRDRFRKSRLRPTDPIRPQRIRSGAAHSTRGGRARATPVSKFGGQTRLASQKFRSERIMLGPSLGILGEVHWTPEGSPSHLLGALSGFQLGCCGQRMLRCGCLHHSQACRRLWEHGSPHPLSVRPHVKHSSMPLRPR